MTIHVACGSINIKENYCKNNFVFLNENLKSSEFKQHPVSVKSENDSDVGVDICSF